MAVREKINVNDASKEELLQIPGVGERTAQAIIDFRESRGMIDDLSELEEAQQIDPHDINKLREWLTAGEEEEEEEEEEEKEEETEEGEEGEGEEEEEW